MMLNALLSMLLIADLPGATTADLSGKVVSPDKVPVSGATVYIQSAAPKKGTATTNEFEYPECGKSVTTDDSGAFKIPGVDASLIYRVLVSADGFRPLMLKKVDPARGEAVATLKVVPKDLEPINMIKGHVVDPMGNPVAGARIEPYGGRDGTQRWWGSIDKICEGEAYTDAKGDFLLITRKPDVQVDVKIFGPKMAATLVALMSPGDSAQEITMKAGVTVTGRVLKGETPLAGINMRIVQQDRGPEHYIGNWDATSDADGKFIFKYLSPNDQFYIYATMKSAAEHGAMSMKKLQSNEEGSTLDAGDFAMEEGHKVSGVVFCSDEKPIPTGAKVLFGRWDGDDTVDMPVGADGKFEFKNVPSDLCEFWVRISGYHVSPDNESFEPANAQFLLGRVDDDIPDLRVKLEPGPSPRTDYTGNKWNQLQHSQMSGMPKE